MSNTNNPKDNVYERARGWWERRPRFKHRRPQSGNAGGTSPKPDHAASYDKGHQSGDKSQPHSNLFDDAAIIGFWKWSLQKRLDTGIWWIGGVAVIFAAIQSGLLWFFGQGEIAEIHFRWVFAILIVSFLIWRIIADLALTSMDYNKRIQLAVEPEPPNPQPLAIKHKMLPKGDIEFAWQIDEAYRGWQLVCARIHSDTADSELVREARRRDETGKPAADKFIILETNSVSDTITDPGYADTYPSYLFHLERRRPKLWFETGLPVKKQGSARSEEVVHDDPNLDLNYRTEKIRITQYIHEMTWKARAKQAGHQRTYETAQSDVVDQRIRRDRAQAEFDKSQLDEPEKVRNIYTPVDEARLRDDTAKLYAEMDRLNSITQAKIDSGELSQAAGNGEFAANERWFQSQYDQLQKSPPKVSLKNARE